MRIPRTVFCALFLVGCATTQSPAQRGAESAGDAVTDQPADAPPEKPAKKREPMPSPTMPTSSTTPSAPSTAPVSSSKKGVLTRAELKPVLDASPALFLQHVQTEPRLNHGKFSGWRIVSFFPGDDRFAGVDLQAGDVVTRINGKPIEQPDQFMAVWTELRSSKELVVDLERNGSPRTLRWIIADK
jgi:general secretion pathway protein C